MKSSVLGTLRKITFKRTQPHSLIALSIILFVFEMDCDILFFNIQKDCSDSHIATVFFICIELLLKVYLIDRLFPI